MSRAIVSIAIFVACLLPFAVGCTSEPSERLEPTEDINWSEADFAADFAALSASEQQAACDDFWSVEMDEYNELLWDAGYTETQIVNSWNVLVEVCP